MPKGRKPFTPLEQLRNLCDALSEDALADNAPLTKAERDEAARLRTELVEFAENYAARLEAEGKVDSPQWTKKAEKRKGRCGDAKGIN